MKNLIPEIYSHLVAAVPKRPTFSQDAINRFGVA